MVKYRKVQDGDWVRPIMSGYRMRCCDCGLVHRMNFKVIRRGPGYEVVFQAWRDEMATRAFRKRSAARDEGS